MSSEPPKEPEHRTTERLRRAIFAVAFGLLGAYAAGLVLANTIVYIWPRPPRALITSLVSQHFVAITGLPSVAVLAFIIVWAFRSTEQAIEIEFRVLGISFKGAAGPVILWVIVFLTIVTGLRIMW
jgi:hypothetical protein